MVDIVAGLAKGEATIQLVDILRSGKREQKKSGACIVFENSLSYMGQRVG